MTKIEEFKKAKGVSLSVATAVLHTLGRDSTRNDKHSFGCRFNGIENATWSPMTFSVECSYGYYGSSSGYSCTSVELGGYLAKAITAHAAILLDAAAKYAAEDAEKCRKAAEKEAHEVLQAIPAAEQGHTA